MPLLLGWTGMRGVVSLAAALAIPVTLDNGQAFPQRNLILFITFVVILLTLLLQGLTLPYFIKKSLLFDNMFSEEEERTARHHMHHGMKQHVYQSLKAKYDGQLETSPALQGILQQWEERARAADCSWMNQHTRDVFIEVLEIQRQYLSQLNKDPAFDEELIREQLYQIDLEEERLRTA